MEVKPIETVYNSYRFRSRLEARWAVFFDVLGIKYEYEPEGYDLGEHGWYLPDFWLPDPGLWLEIKGANPSEIELRRIAFFGFNIAPIGVFVGMPAVTGGTLFCVDSTDSGCGGDFELSECLGFEFCYNQKKTVIGVDEPRFLCRTRWLFTPDYTPLNIHPPDPASYHFHGAYEVVQAAIAARQARFEFGQVGAPKNWRE